MLGVQSQVQAQELVPRTAVMAIKPRFLLVNKLDEAVQFHGVQMKEPPARVAGKPLLLPLPLTPTPTLTLTLTLTLTSLHRRARRESGVGCRSAISARATLRRTARLGSPNPDPDPNPNLHPHPHPHPHLHLHPHLSPSPSPSP